MRLRQLFEAPRTAVMAFGRMNPPTIGHAKLVDAVKSQGGDPYIFLSQSQKPKTDPLPFEEKLRYAKFFFPNVTIGSPEVKTIIQALQKISELGYENLIYVAGSDRVPAFEELINKYNGKDYNFKNIQVVSAGERDPDADGAEGMSASKMRAAAAAGDLESFKQGVPNQEVADEMYAAVRQGMGIKDEEPVAAEEAPPGRERQVKALKKEFPDDEGAPYAIAWAQHNKKNKNKTTETRGTTLPQKIDVVKMPQPPQAPTTDTPDGTDENGTRINTTPKGNRSVKNGGGTYIFTPQGKLMLYMSPKIGGLQQTHNLIKKTVTVNFGTAVDQGDGDVNIDQKATYDMQGNLISDDNLSMNRGDLSVGLDKDDGISMNYRVNSNTTVGANSRRGISVNRNDPEVNEETVELPDGETKTTKPDGSYIISGARGKEFFDKNGNLIKTHSPSINGLTLIKYSSGKGRYIYKAGGADTRGPLDGDKPGEADYIAYAFGGARFVFDARNGQPKISGSVEMGRLKVEFTGKVLDRPSFQKNVRQSMAEILGGDPLNILKDPMAAKPMVDKGTAKLYFDGKPIGAEQLAQVVQEL